MSKDDSSILKKTKETIFVSAAMKEKWLDQTYQSLMDEVNTSEMRVHEALHNLETLCLSFIEKLMAIRLAYLDDPNTISGRELVPKHASIPQNHENVLKLLNLIDEQTIALSTQLETAGTEVEEAAIQTDAAYKAFGLHLQEKN